MRQRYQSDSSDTSDRSDKSDPYSLRNAPAEVAANTLICLINQASFLLGRQLQKLEQQFLSEGGFTERLYRERRAVRERDKEQDRTDRANPLCNLFRSEQDRGPDFRRLATALSALYPKESEGERLLDAMFLAMPR